MKTFFPLLLLPCLAAFAAGQCPMNAGFDINPGPANDINPGGTKINTPEECCQMCKGNAACKAWVFGKFGKKCWLKNISGFNVANGDRISGVVVRDKDCLPDAQKPNAKPNMNCYHVCATGDKNACQCCKDKGRSGGKCYGKVPYCF